MPIIILSIETSCDDTSAAIIVDGEVRSNVIATQEVHAKYGGVVPELASRKHQIHIIPVVDQAIKEAGVTKKDLQAIAFTRGPGLLGSLIVGVTFAKGLALALDIPLIEVHHMHAHVLAHFAEEPKPTFPFLCLTVSGGHTEIIRMDNPLMMKILGKTIDDAAGEAFDKTGKLLGLPYPSGPLIDTLSKSGQARFPFPEPSVDGLNFSFSGLKTSILYFLQREMKKNPNFIPENLNDICASVQSTIVRILVKKLKMAVDMTGIKEVAIAGGVSANSELRKTFMELAVQEGWNIYIPAIEYCTDNAAMIGIAAWYKYKKKIFSHQNVTPEPRYGKWV